MSRVLIVHADPALGARLAAAIMEAGLEAVVVTSGERAMDRFIQEPADVLVIDYDLDGRDGITAAEAIRWMPGGRRARLILTAITEPEDGNLESLASGLDAFATRVGPFEPRRVASLASRAAAVRPHEAETRILTADESLLEAEKMKGAVSDGWREPTHEEPSRAVALPVSLEHSAEEPLEAGTYEDASRERWELPDADGTAEGEEVRRFVSATPRVSSELFGSFDDMGFSRVLSKLADQRATGALICIHPPDERATTSGTEPTKIVYFRAGVPAHVRSNVVRECLGQVLQRQRKIGPVTLKESVDAVRRGEGRQGEVLVRMGAISPVELSEALAEQLRVKLFDLFFWEHGSFRFAPDRPPPSELIDLEMGLAEIAFRGIRLAVPMKRALEILSPHEREYVIPRARKLVRFVRLSIFSDGLRDVIRKADGTRTVGELLDGAQIAGEAAQLLHAMESLDAVSFRAVPIRPRREPSRSGPAPVAGPHIAPPRPRALGTDSEEMPTHSAVESEDPPTQTDASDPAIPVAESPNDMVTLDVATIDTPREPLAPLDGLPDEVPDWEETTANEELDVASMQASLDSVDAPELALEPRTPTAAPVQDDTSYDPSSPSEQEALTGHDASGEHDESSIQSALSILDAPAIPDAPSNGDSGMREKPAESAEALDARVKAQLKAERLFRRGQRALDKDEATKALDCFESAAALCPDETRFALYVVYGEHALAPDDETLRERALDRIERACDEDPDLAAGHLLRARLLTSAQRAGEAQLAYARVLELEPSNRAAKVELKALRAL